MPRLIGTDPNQVPLNQFLGTMAFQNIEAWPGPRFLTGQTSTVTQITSRTTGVTINSRNGSITLVSAAGTTTVQSFTVTNSEVAVGDLVVVNQRSGTDLYDIKITNIAAGSFRISFATTGGTTTEQPVFNFGIIKGSPA